MLVGKSNAPENGWAITSEPKLYGATHNPWRADVTPGGSSGGAASAVAAGMVPLAEASDGAGSIRVPASCCGVIGLKPSRGRITIAPFGDFWYGGAYFFCVTRTVRDTAAYLDAMTGALPGDPYTPPTPSEPWAVLATRAPKRLRIGFSMTPPDGSPIDPEAVVAVRKAASLLERLGHCVEEKNMALDAASAWKTYTAMTPAESAAGFDFLTPLAGRPVTQADVEPVTWAIIQRGRAQTAVEHVNLMNALRGLSRDIAADLMPYDVYLTPVLTQKPRPLGYWDMSEPDLDRYNARWTDAVFMFPFNIAPLPAIALPLHWSADGLPIGVQAVGRYGDEATLLALAAVLEAETKWADRHPPYRRGRAGLPSRASAADAAAANDRSKKAEIDSALAERALAAFVARSRKRPVLEERVDHVLRQPRYRVVEVSARQSAAPGDRAGGEYGAVVWRGEVDDVGADKRVLSAAEAGRHEDISLPAPADNCR